MIEAASAETISRLASPAPKKPRGEDGAFSYALAATSLEKSASASLKTFGATSQKIEGAQQPSDQKSTAAGAQSNDAGGAPATTSETSSKSQGAPQSIKASLPQAPANAAPVASAQPQSAGPIAPTVASAPPAAATTAQRAPQGVEAPRADVSKSAAARYSFRARRPDAPVRTPGDFAELVARRLKDGKSEFDIRLDPPRLGRVEGRLVVGDDGKTTLTLTFDNQAALDHFARDADALQAALAGAGFDLNGSDLSFALAERGNRDQAAPHQAATADGFNTPARTAWLALDGVIDIKV